MEPNDIPTIAGASGAGGGNGSPPVSVDAIRRLAAERELYVRDITNELVEATREAAGEAEKVSDESMGTVFVELTNRAADAAKRVQKGADVIFREVRDKAADAEARTHAAITQLGGSPLVMTDEAYAVNQQGNAAAEALERIILPAIDQQAKEPDAGPIIDGVPPEREPPIPIPGLPAEPVPGPVVEPPGEPPPEPSPFVPPPSPGDVCCPPQQIVVPAPVVNVVVDWSKFPGTYPVPLPPPPGVVPPVPPPPGTVPPPPVSGGSPPPPVGPPPATSLPRLPSEPVSIVPVGTMDGPLVCQRITEGVTSLGRAGSNMAAIPQAIVGGILSSPIAGVPIIGDIIKGIGSAVDGALGSLFTTLSGQLVSQGLPEPAVALSHLAVTGAASIVDRYLGMDSSYYLQPVIQSAKAANPLNIVPQGDIDRMYLADRIDAATWECLTKLHGNMPWQHQQAMLASQARLPLSDLTAAARRGLISLDNYMIEARRLGYVDSDYPRLAYALSEYVPSTPDLFTWIKKDVFRDDFAERFGLDEDFPNDLPPAFQRWFAANGTSPDQIKYDYRAQWRLPSTTQLGEMVARLRPGRVPEAIQITAADADQLLKLDEWPARLRGQILATLTTPVNRTDLIEGYKAGTVDDAELVERLMDLKYSRDDALFLARMIKAKSIGQQQGSMGAWTRRRIVREYVSGTITREVADRLLSRTVLSPAERVAALDDADEIASANRRRSCIKGIRRRYFTGELDAGAARAELTAQGVGLIVAAELLAGWTCERKSRSKEPTVKQLTEWVSLGIIDVNEYRRRLINLGYTEGDAERIIAAAGIKFQQQQRKPKK